MGIHIVAVGKIRTTFLRSACDEYIKRLSRYCKVDMVEIRSNKGGSIRINVERESKNVLRYIRQDRTNILLDEEGKEVASKEFADLLWSWMSEKGGKVAFFIGGTDGVDPKIRKEFDGCIALSRMTFTHEMARALLLEQIYRAFTIKIGGPYHH
ncbi:MAG: 23S rRNA (pseudouridine(1915)-N(3))-methyltransferase RlmH [Thermotoga sp.]|nr:MAG: 23S rRNA (pseudouridine(1915)-N(3))-methyltransferase RlmH [Thermotoga sp.]